MNNEPHSHVNALTTIATEEFKTNDFGDTFLYSLNGDMFDRFGAATILEDTYGDLIFKENHLYFVIGTDSGLLPQFIAHKHIPKGTRYIFIEPEPILRKLQTKVADLHKNILLSLPEKAIHLAEEQGILGAAFYALNSKIRLILSLSALNETNAFYSEIHASLRDSLIIFERTVQTEFTSAFHMSKSFFNCVDAYPHASFLRRLKPYTSGKTAIVLAGGPSLELFIDWVHAIQEEVVLIAVSRVTERLKAKGITPDIIVTADPQAMSLDVSKGMFLDTSPLLVCTGSTAPVIVGQWPGTIAFAGFILPYDSTFNIPDNIDVAEPTVSNFATNIANEIGVSQIILLGVDFCYTAEGATHITGTGESKKPVSIGRTTIEITTNDGSRAPSPPDLIQARDYFIHQTYAIANNGIQLINPSPKSAKVPAVKFVPIADLTIDPLDRPIAKEIKKIYPHIDKRNHLNALKTELSCIQERIREVQRLADIGVKTIEQLKDAEGSSYKQLLSTIRALKSRIYSEPIFELIRIWGDAEFAKISSCFETDDSSRNVTLESHRLLFSAFSLIGGDINVLINDTLERLASRLEETKDHPDFISLAIQWRKDRQPGRAAVWRAQNPNAAETLSPEENLLLNELESEFQTMLSTTGTAYESYLDRESSLDKLLPKITQYFQRGDATALARLESTIKTHPDTNRKYYLKLVQGVNLELQMKYNDALKCFHYIVNNPIAPTLALALEHIAFISVKLKDHATALHALECLSQISERYQPHFAELLDSAGLIQDAISVLEGYCSSHPEDISNHIKLSRLRLDNGDVSGAIKLCEHILDLEPDNKFTMSFLATIKHDRQKNN